MGSEGTASAELLLVALVAITIVAEIRSGLHGGQAWAPVVARVALLGVISSAVMSGGTPGSEVKRRNELGTIMMGLNLLLALNFGAWLAGFRGPREVFRSALPAAPLIPGLIDVRPVFPFIEGGQYLAYLGASGVVLGVAALFAGVRVFRSMVLIALGVATVVLYGTRGAALGGAVGVIAVLFRVWRAPKGLLLGLGSTVLVSIGIALGWNQDGYRFLGFWIDSSMVQGVLSNRPVIWATAGMHMLSAGPFDLLVGYGARGQVTTGMSADYAFLLENRWLNPEGAPLHNSFLQAAVDQGILGISVFVTAFLGSIHRAARHARQPSGEKGEYLAAAPFGVLLVLFVGGLFESMVSTYCLPIFLLFLWACHSTLATPTPTPTERTISGSTYDFDR